MISFYETTRRHIPWEYDQGYDDLKSHVQNIWIGHTRTRAHTHTRKSLIFK
jgi:hypothetical protein